MNTAVIINAILDAAVLSNHFKAVCGELSMKMNGGKYTRKYNRNRNRNSNSNRKHNSNYNRNLNINCNRNSNLNHNCNRNSKNCYLFLTNQIESKLMSKVLHDNIIVLNFVHAQS